MPSPRSLPTAWRPREKLMRLGGSAVSLEELWMCILGMGSQQKPVQVLAKFVAQHWEEENHEWLATLGKSQAARVLAINELFKRVESKKHFQIRSSEDVVLLSQDLVDARQEQIIAWYLSNSSEVLHQERLAVGSLNAALIQPKELFFPVRNLPVAAIILCHNHPSGNPSPSPEDLVFTKRMAAACELMGLRFEDHIIVARNGHYSFWKEGVM